MKKTWFQALLLISNFNKRLWITAFIVLLLILNTALVLVTGGIPSAFAHTMYIPVFLAAMFLGLKGVVITAVLAGFFVGPFVSLEIWQVSSEPLINSSYRTLYFLLVGVITYVLLTYLKAQIIYIEKSQGIDADTGIPNFHHYLSLHKFDVLPAENVAITLQINNYEMLVLLLGHEHFRKVLKGIYDKLVHLFPESALICLVDRRRFWIDIPAKTNFKLDDSLLDALEETTIYEAKVPLYLDYSLGVHHTADGQTALVRMKKSDIASVYASTHKLRYVEYHEKHEDMQHTFKRLGEIPEAIEKDELFLIYQPIIDLETEKITGLEALIRWRYGDQILEPVDFIPFAEKTRIIDRITSWVLDRVISDHAKFKKAGFNPKLTMNISQRNLYEQPLIDAMINKIKASNMPPDSLEVEITESTLMLNRSVAQSFLRRFKQIGIGSILDDFGTEYSSLMYLKALPINKVKIDRLFTMNIIKDNEVRMMVDLIVKISHQMNFKVIAEGIETEAVATAIKDLGCDYGQGYYYARPMTVPDTISWLKKHNT